MSAALDCSSLNGTEFAMCEFMQGAKAVDVTCEAYQYLTEEGCMNYTSNLQKTVALQGLDATVDTGNTAWMLFSTAAVMLMTPGLAFFYAGLAGQESASNTIMMSWISMSIVTVQWYLFGYSITFAPGNPWIGDLSWATLAGVGYAPSGAYGVAIPHYIFMIFQCMFAQITPALISGAVIGRMKFSSYIIFILLWTTFVYDPLAHAVWAFWIDEAFELKAIGFIGSLGAIDFAGGTCIHIASGFSALAAALILGKRRSAGQKLKPHNVPLVVLGGAFLWFGWFGFNGGSAVSSGGIASLAFLNTHFAACSGLMIWMCMEYLVDKTISPGGAISGAVAGLVCITPACGFVAPWAAFLFGAFASPVCFGAVKMKEKLGFDDTLDSFAVHGVGGFLGAILTGLFADPSLNFATGGFYGDGGVLLGYQIGASLYAATYSFLATAIILLLLKFTIGIRVSEDAEEKGLDASYHGGDAYDTKPKEEKM